MPDTIDDDLADQAGELILEAEEQLQQNRAEQEAFLEDIAEDEGAEMLETTCNIKGHTVDISAKLNGDLWDAMGRIDDRLERFERGESGAYEYGESADEVARILDDVTDDPKLHKKAFYETYQEHGLGPLGAILEEVFEALRKEKERRSGVADGFRKKQSGN